MFINISPEWILRILNKHEFGLIKQQITSLVKYLPQAPVRINEFTFTSQILYRWENS